LPSLSERLEVKIIKEIKKWKKENPSFSLLDVAQQVNYTSVLLRTIGSKAEEDYKKNF
jgi:hypothetical protein